MNLYQTQRGAGNKHNYLLFKALLADRRKHLERCTLIL